MTAQNRCKRSVKNCPYCTTGIFKRPARRKARHVVKNAMRERMNGYV